MTGRPAQPSTAAEAARYALIRRLAPSMRHHLVVNLQPIGMIYEVMDRRLRAAQPDLSQVKDSADKINGFAKAALHSSIDVVGWLAPDETVPIAVDEAVREGAALLATSLSFRGYALRNEVQALPRTVRRCAIRNLLTATLLHLTDQRPAPAELVITVTQGETAELQVLYRATEGDDAFRGEANYRKLAWADLEALAAADGVAVEQEADRIRLRFPWMES